MNKDNFVILDIETNVEENTPLSQHFSVIQLGATKIKNGEFSNYDTFNSYINPKAIPPDELVLGTKLTDFIKQLTKIKQEQVNEAEWFPVVWNQFLVFSAPYFEYFVSWGKYDWDVLRRNCEYYDMPFPFRYHVNLKDYYKAFFNNKEVKLGAGVKAATEFFGLPFNDEGAHNGLEDARMITAIAKAMADKGFYTFKKSRYEFDGELLIPTKSTALQLNPVLVGEYNELEKEKRRISNFLFQDRLEPIK